MTDHNNAADIAAEYEAITAHSHVWSEWARLLSGDGRRRWCLKPGCYVEEDEVGDVGHTYLNWERAINALSATETMDRADVIVDRHAEEAKGSEIVDHFPNFDALQDPVVDLAGLDDLPDPKADAVNHPSHYTGFSNGAEVIDIIEHLPLLEGNAVKYLARAGRKGGADRLQDLEKAQWYVNRAIAKLRAERGL